MLSLKTSSEDLAAAISTHASLIAAEVLATELRDLDVTHTSQKAGGEPLEIGLTRC